MTTFFFQETQANINSLGRRKNCRKRYSVFSTMLMIFKSISKTVCLLLLSNTINLKISSDSNKGYSLIVLSTSTYRIFKVITYESEAYY